jgi:hypothetical protein
LAFTFPLNFPDSIAGQTMTLALTFHTSGGATWTSSAKVNVVSDPGPAVPLVPEPDQAAQPMLGDADGNRKINTIDATRALRFVVGLETSPDLLLALDVSPPHADGMIGDDKMTTADAILILKKAIGLDSF